MVRGSAYSRGRRPRVVFGLRVLVLKSAVVGQYSKKDWANKRPAFFYMRNEKNSANAEIFDRVIYG